MSRIKTASIFITLILLTIMILIPKFVSSSIPNVDVVNPVITSYSQYINCEGEIVDSLKENIVADVPIIPKSVYVENGDYVKAGQKLIDINKEATINTFSNATTADVLSVFMSADIDNLPTDLISEILSNQDSSNETLNQYISDEVIPSAIYATSDGFISDIKAKPGVITPAMSTIASIAENNEKKAKISVGENNISKIKLGQKVSITGLAFPGQTYFGYTTDIAQNARKILKGTNVETVVDVTVSLDSYEDLKTGYTAKAKISLTPERKVLTVPYEYVMQDNDQNEFVYVYQNGKALKQIIRTGVELTAGFEVISGIDQNTKIITNPDSIKYSGSYVKISDEG